MKTKILKELKKKDFLSQSIMLNWLRSQTNITFSKEERFNKLLKDMIVEEVEEAIAQTREETLKELIREYQDNELDGKGYDFYFSIRVKIDELNKLKK